MLSDTASPALDCPPNSMSLLDNTLPALGQIPAFASCVPPFCHSYYSELIGHLLQPKGLQTVGATFCDCMYSHEAASEHQDALDNGMHTLPKRE